MGKFIFTTGGVVSSLGKGITAASIALLLERQKLSVAILKLDPYLNVDPGTMNPFQHGEVYVTDDGAETDLDLGHYYRYTDSPLSKNSNATSGQIYDTVIKKERHGDYLGHTVQVIPHITNEIKRRIRLGSGEKSDITIVEIGGTVGDIESLPFLEAIRQFRTENPKECINIHLTYVPYLKASGEVKTKPESVGRAISGTRIKVVNEKGEECAVGEKGEILAKGDNVMLGYWKNEKETAKVIKNGWLHTGDIAFKDKDGDLFIGGRKKDFIKVGANRVSPLEIESLIIEDARVMEAAVIGVADDILGERIKLFVTLMPGEKMTGEETIILCRKRLPSYKIPADVVMLKSMPKNSYGKIDKDKLRPR